MALEVLGLEHLDLTVSDLGRSALFYNKVLGELGFKRLADDVDNFRWANAFMSIAIRPASTRRPAFSRYRVGLHHVAFKAKSREAVDEFHRFLEYQGINVLDPPAEYPQYGPRYYAVFFADPDGIKIEFAHFPWGYWRRVQQGGADERPRYVGGGNQ